MSAPQAIDPEMRRRFEAAEKIRLHETPLRRPALRPTAESLRAHFAAREDAAPAPLENPHVEPRVAPEARERAVPSSVLIPIALREERPTVLVTQRHHDISFPNHWVFPGGRSDAGEPPLETALREAEEEIGLARERIEVLGRLGEYVSHSGHRIVPVVGLVHPPFTLRAQPGEVVAIDEIPLPDLLRPDSYFLFRFRDRPDRAHFALEASPGGPMLTGVTVSLAIGLYAALLESHA